MIKEICDGGLMLPVFGVDFILTTDFSYNGIGGVVSQIVDGVERPVMFVSRVLTSADLKYSPTEGEALAIVFALKRCEHLLYGQHVIIRTDHRPLTFINSGHESNRKLARWWSIVNEFDYELQYVQGKVNVVADALSRLTNGTVAFENETLELQGPSRVMTSTVGSCECVDEPEDECDLCGKTICFGCELATPANLQFIYCKDCVDLLDNKDPTMNLALLRLLKGNSKQELLAEYGYDYFFKLVEVSRQYKLVGETLFKVFSDRVREIPSKRRRK